MVELNKATELARTLVLQLISLGVKDAVLSPGSRNAPLSIALFAAEQRGLINLHVQIDERSAGFFALGISKASLMPVALVCTSGTAAANYHPALLEAWHCQIPLIAITADRPANLRQTGANQTTLQPRMFSDCTQYELDIAESDIDLSAALAALRKGPIHLNVQFTEPLLPEDKDDWLASAVRGRYLPKKRVRAGALKIDKTRGVIVIGHDRAGFTASEVEEFVDELGWPVVAEDPISFERAVVHAALFLTSAQIRDQLKPEIVIVIGRTTLSRSVNALIKSAAWEIVIDPRIANVDIKRAADEIFQEFPELQISAAQDPNWKSLWEYFSSQTSKVIAELLPWSEPAIARSLVEKLAPKSTLFVSSSRPIRDLEAFASYRSGIETFANRGLAGIDGNISTALGIASQRTSCTALIGDLAFLHDHNGLLHTANINLRILVINNDGGGIFSTLPQSGESGFEKIFGTPHGHDLVAIGNAMGILSNSVSTMSDLERELAKPVEGVSIVIAQMPTREENAARLRALHAQIAQI